MQQSLVSNMREQEQDKRKGTTEKTLVLNKITTRTTSKINCYLRIGK